MKAQTLTFNILQEFKATLVCYVCYSFGHNATEGQHPKIFWVALRRVQNTGQTSQVIVLPIQKVLNIHKS